jgi:hypothetical protein
MTVTIKGIKLTLSPDITDIQIGTIQACLSDINSPKNQENLAYLIKNVLFLEAVPDSIVAVRNGNYILNTSGSDTALIGVTAVETFYTSLIAKLKENATPELTEKLNGAEFEIVKSIQEIKAQWQLAA